VKYRYLQWKRPHRKCSKMRETILPSPARLQQVHDRKTVSRGQEAGAMDEVVDEGVDSSRQLGPSPLVVP
jgi:hypothetical protein